MNIVRLLVLLSLFSLTATAQNDLPPMKRITGRNTPAHLAAKGFMRGANIANCLEVPPTEHWSVPHSVLDLKQIRAEGFDHIRLPVGWHYYAGPAPDFKLSDDIFARADYMVTNATALGLNVIVNLHDFFALNTNPAASTAEFLAIWRQVAAHYAQAPDGVAFELLNEPREAATTVAINPIYAEAIRQIRQTNPHRTIFVGPGKFNSPDELRNLRLPDDDDNLIVTLHCYDPLFFTHQGANWVGPEYKQTGIHYPGPPKTPLTTRSRPEIETIGSVQNQPVQHTTCRQQSLRSPGLSPQDSEGQSLVGKIWAARSLWRIRGLHHGRPGIARPLLRSVAAGPGRRGHRLGDLGLEIRFQLLGRQNPTTPARNARGALSRQQPKSRPIIWLEQATHNPSIIFAQILRPHPGLDYQGFAAFCVCLNHRESARKLANSIRLGRYHDAFAVTRSRFVVWLPISMKIQPSVNTEIPLPFS